MEKKFCINCGQEKILDAKFCGNCGSAFSEALEQSAATATSLTETAATVEHTTNDGSSIVTNKISKPKTLGSIIVNILFAILLFVSKSVMDRHLDWGGGESNLITILILLIGVQLFTLFLQKKQRSYSILLPTVISLFSIFSTYSLYQDFSDWVEYQGFQTQQMVQGDLTLILVYLVFFIVSTALNVLFFLKSKK